MATTRLTQQVEALIQAAVQAATNNLQQQIDQASAQNQQGQADLAAAQADLVNAQQQIGRPVATRYGSHSGGTRCTTSATTVATCDDSSDTTTSEIRLHAWYCWSSSQFDRLLNHCWCKDPQGIHR
jgi:multidrug resistance efflux pump